MSATRDRPQHDPHVKALGGFDVAAMSVAELRAIGVELSPRAFAPKAGRKWLTHSEYDGQHREHANVARAYARQLAHAHVAAKGEVRGLRLPRSFPCLGTFRLVDDFRRGPVVVACDVCGEELGVDWPRDDDGELSVPAHPEPELF